jgi:hypothetical protein
MVASSRSIPVTNAIVGSDGLLPPMGDALPINHRPAKTDRFGCWCGLEQSITAMARIDHGDGENRSRRWRESITAMARIDHGDGENRSRLSPSALA